MAKTILWSSMHLRTVFAFDIMPNATGDSRVHQCMNCVVNLHMVSRGTLSRSEWGPLGNNEHMPFIGI